MTHINQLVSGWRELLMLVMLLLFWYHTAMRYLMLDNIRSAHNVGSIFRTADAAGVSKIFLIGTTPCPRDRFGRPVAEIEKTSLGATKTVLWEYHAVPTTVMAQLQKENVAVVSIEQTPQSISLYTYVPPVAVCYVLGNEVTGVSKEIIAASTVVVEIPMYGHKESLNVSVAAGIVLFCNRSAVA